MNLMKNISQKSEKDLNNMFIKRSLLFPSQPVCKEDGDEGEEMDCTYDDGDCVAI